MNESKLHLFWGVPLAVVLGVLGFALGTFGWCGDDALGCRFGPESALQSGIPPAITGAVVGAIIGTMFAIVPWSGSVARRRQVGWVVGTTYLVLTVCYLVVTLSING